MRLPLIPRLAGTFGSAADNSLVMKAPTAAPGVVCDGAVISASLTEPEVFTAIFDRHFDAIHRYLARRLGRDLADDLTSLTFTVAFERRGSFRPQTASARPWLFGIATNLARNHRRAEQRLLDTVARVARDPLTTGVQLDGEQPSADSGLAQSLASLDPDQRDVLFLYAWGELTYEEIGASLAIPVGTVRSRLSRAREHVRAELARSGRDATAAHASTASATAGTSARGEDR